MQRIHDPTAAPALPATPVLTGPAGYFTGGVPGAVAPTIVRDWWLNMIQEELLALLTAAGITPDTTGSNYTQVLQSIRTFGGAGTMTTFTSGGTFVVPAGVRKVRVRLWGGGAGGGGMGNSGPGGGGGGGGGGYAEGIYNVTAGASFNVSVGAGGNPGSAGGGTGGGGGTSSFGALISATGGAGGSGDLSGTGIGGYAGSGYGGQINVAPNVGGQNGILITTSWLGGTGGGSFCTSMTSNPAGSGFPGNFPGGGGSGGIQNLPGGVGGAGAVVVEY